MVLDNDTRGLIMTIISGVACVFGASIICVDIIIRQIPGKKNFKIEDSNAFLSMGLSLSFGVMIFSSLYSMLPSSKRYLIKGGMSPKAATLTLIGFFLLGALGISILSRILHKYIPHKVVDCDHKHDEEDGKADDEMAHSHHSTQGSLRDGPHVDAAHDGHHSYGTNNETVNRKPVRRPSLHNAISSRVTQFVTGAQKLCDENGQCYGYSDACGTECFKNVQTRPSRLSSTKSTGNLTFTRQSGLSRTQTMHSTHDRRILDNVNETTPLVSRPTTTDGSTASAPSTNGIPPQSTHDVPPLHKHSRTSSTSSASSHASHASHASHTSHTSHTSATHHHHVPTNVFLSLGLQTSTAIALHKVPEGFITYATNHASPTLGLSVFLALFIHNITEGFALALPLYLALSSRWKAMAWSAALGGASQPLGAGVAALWFRLAGQRGHGEDGAEGGEVLYGCMFAGTAGVMAMVSLQLLGESLDLTHSRRLCFVSAFVGMGVLGLSSALTA